MSSWTCLHSLCTTDVMTGTLVYLEKTAIARYTLYYLDKKVNYDCFITNWCLIIMQVQCSSFNLSRSG